MIQINTDELPSYAYNRLERSSRTYEKRFKSKAVFILLISWHKVPTPDEWFNGRESP